MPLALAARNATQRPSLPFVGLDHVGEGRELGILRAVLGATHQRVDRALPTRI